MEFFAGLAVSIKEMHICVVDRDRAVIHAGKAPSTPADLEGHVTVCGELLDLANEASPMPKSHRQPVEGPVQPLQPRAHLGRPSLTSGPAADLLQVGACAEHPPRRANAQHRDRARRLDPAQRTFEIRKHGAANRIHGRGVQREGRDAALHGKAEQLGHGAQPSDFLAGLRKFGLRFSRKAMPPSRDSSVS